MTEHDNPSRFRLSGAKLSAIVRAETDADLGPLSGFDGGAALVAGDTSWVLVDGDAGSSLGPAMAWAERHGTIEVSIIAEEGAGILARRAELFSHAPKVFSLDGTDLSRTAADGPPQVAPPPDEPELAAQLVEAGLDVTVEHGMLLGELRGLELARVVRVDDGVELMIGVGELDREMTAEVHQHLPRPEALARIVEIVDQQRVSTSPLHPLRDLCPERWLRTVLVIDPELVGCSELAAAPSPFARMNLLERSTAAATGHDADGSPVVLITSVGVDLDLVPTAADLRAHLDPESRLIVVVPERDRHGLIESMAARVTSGCEIRTVPTEWRRP